ncbi:putative NAD(P)H nitroreductase YfkO [bioreactor metagenome]|uniref:Putative NAD(P)H nitroreductase YfkO n=1 Tax=bioreactor metagenome TaxID=1076179 RepID=A0A644T663_9ZZZZ|nr:NAD(P)H-dependent oxidoreductase [Candidatus Elulimicrobiales bacterium]
MSFLENLNWRYATKKFDTTKKISEENLQKIREAIRLAPASMGLQLYKILEVTNGEVREKMRAASNNQPQVTDADRVFVFLASIDGENRVEEMFTEMSGGNAEVRENNLKGYEDMVRGFALSKSHDNLLAWSQKNLGIALGFALAACAELKIDACPMDGFDPLQIKEILGAGENFFPVAYLAVGYRDESDETSSRPKWRLPLDKTIQKI